ncbi:MAG: DUF357 domain-containing protein [Candidatus ainarchaeum sp.]|nr:DUF357 domain-containing protein [Candidatus ainarchaeum sp.]
MDDKIIIEKVEKYAKITKKGIDEIKVKPNLNEKEKKIALDFLSMAKNYYSDGLFFKEKKDYLTALASFSYAHAWLDSGVRAHLFDATDDQLFTLP